MKRPTIKATNRAYVRLYEFVIKRMAWDDFLAKYRVEMVPHGQERAGGCAVQVLGSDGALADLGPAIPNRITYSTFVQPDRTTWTEYYRDGHMAWRNVDSR